MPIVLICNGFGLRSLDLANRFLSWWCVLTGTKGLTVKDV